MERALGDNITIAGIGATSAPRSCDDFSSVDRRVINMSSRLILALSDDLIDASRLTGHGRAAGHEVLHCRTLAILESALARGPAIVIVDLHFPELDVAALADRLLPMGVRMIGYGSHVDAARLKSARSTGIVALPRSAFFEDLDAHLANWTASPA